MPRYLSIDILRGVAILLMIQVHFVENLSPRAESFQWLYDASMKFGSVSASFFTFLSGVSYSLWVRKQEDLRRRNREITRGTLRRGVFLFALGIVFNFVIWLPEETFNWDILTLIGVAYLFLAVARNLPSPVLVLICLMVILTSPLLRTVCDYGSYWHNYEYSYDFTFRDVFSGFVANGYFPVFPWIVFPIAGFASGDAIFRPQRRRNAIHRRLVGVGLGLLALCGLGAALRTQLPPVIVTHYLNGVTEFPASTGHMVLMLALNLLALVLLHRSVDRQDNSPRTGWGFVTIVRFSTFSLTIYVLHHVVMLWPLWVYGASMGHEDSTIYWRQAMPTPVAFALGVVCIVACHFGLQFLEHHPKWSLESLMRRMCDGREVAKAESSRSTPTG